MSNRGENWIKHEVADPVPGQPPCDALNAGEVNRELLSVTVRVDDAAAQVEVVQYADQHGAATRRERDDRTTGDAAEANIVSPLVDDLRPKGSGPSLSRLIDRHEEELFGSLGESNGLI